ncbi:MAG: nuclear transport factor 2 family protein [Alphaproteobacteria bacterium]|nr:nuclear transport factor 2 family protein [Rhizobiaceae bacterium]MBU3959808.1 nuclear transport factor 2 family protein [Alphaproteobacteria bacterium]MBU4050879.1 nuclear transport factor 2 family protein [Alphaproteobacteria bacterium]MBU4087602.1 nuclear transport factor 2 family protein [Alphaproteobacteria bacterium]MBU4155600.1 nuclear transport factor 2 family protein [Alphaproteobacteria bacterium]
MTFDPVAAAKRYLDAVNDLDFAVIEDFYAEDAVYGSVKVGGLEGRDAILKAFRQYFKTYPDQQAVDELIEAVSPLAARSVWRLKATNAETGEPLIRFGEETITFNAEGKIISVVVTDYKV